MRQFLVKLNSVSDVKRFVTLATTRAFEVYVQTASQRVSAKSFMGMFSLDYREPVQVVAQCQQAEWEEFGRDIQEFILEA